MARVPYEHFCRTANLRLLTEEHDYYVNTAKVAWYHSINPAPFWARAAMCWREIVFRKTGLEGLG